MSKKLTHDEFRLLKDRLYRAKNALELAIESCPEINFPLMRNNGRELDAGDILARLAMAREDCWKHGPPDTQRRHFQKIVHQQPRG